MKNTEKIAELKKRMEKKSLPESAKAKLKEMIEKLEKEGADEGTKKEEKPKKEKKKTETKEKSEPKKYDDYKCYEIIAEAKARKEKQKKASKKAEKTPTITKDEIAIEKIGDRIKKHYK
ncbi:hypothetical protein, partial [Mesomycoplasma ovipneumoniae]|uniref:hypothetical protein n=1 Tax=Mesomycoplasma ovipneumoniae TaxID=29562 RepID=UPI00307FDADA